MHYVIDSLEHVQQRTKICQELIISWEINFAKLFNKLKYFTHISTFKNIPILQKHVDFILMLHDIYYVVHTYVVLMLL